MQTRAETPAEFMLFIPNPRISHPKQTLLPGGCFLYLPHPTPVTIWFTVLSLCSCKHVDFTRIATLFASGHVSSSLPVTFTVVLGTELFWYGQYA